eukprot:11154991-Lingulodinium_polyedra.AAC.1
MDFMDSLAPRLSYFNVCRAKTGWSTKKGIMCGYAFPEDVVPVPRAVETQVPRALGANGQGSPKRPQEKMLNEW